MSLRNYIHTIKYLKMEQLYFQIYYKLRAKLRKMLGRKEKYTYYKRGNHISFFSFPEKTESYKGNDTFEFLNLTHRFCGVWDDRELGDLWRYNLNYMDFILQPGMTVADSVRWMECFIDAVHDNRIATDPYPISLRGVNWIKFVSFHRDELTDTQLCKIDTSLYSQYRILNRCTERHLLANHYLENGFSLLFAAVYFNDKTFWRKAKYIVEHQLKEQILDDGAHYELSPMYHCIILERLLDCYNLLCSVDDSSFDGLPAMRNLLTEKASRMLAWLDAIVVADDSIPLLNDSAYGVALLPCELREYATRLGLEWSCGVLGDSGYRRVIRSGYEVVLDMANLGVSYNLGHAHADSATFLLWVKGRELLVEAGTSTYSAGERRNYERSTRAHNTVALDGENSSKVWGAFRCAQRAQTEILEDGPDVFTLSHSGYVQKGLDCRRSFVCNGDSVEIIDVIVGNSQYVAEAYFHLSPEVKVLSIDGNCVVVDGAVFSFEGCKSLQLIQVNVAKEYNVLRPTTCICVSFDDRLHTVINGFD